MASFDVWDVVKVPFPYTDRPVRQFRPAVVVAADALAGEHGLLWVLMITSADNRRWTGDVKLAGLAPTGLPAPSMVRCAKIATIEASEAVTLGALSPADRRKVAANIAKTLRGAMPA